MATRTSSQSGNWSSSSTWGGAAAPGNADDAVISVGHDVAVDVATTVGNSGATSTTAVVVRGTLTVNAPLTLRGDISQERTGSVVGSSTSGNTGAITFDPPGGSTYAWRTPNTGTGTPSIALTGASGGRFVVTTSARGGGNWFGAWSAYPPAVSLAYVTFQNIGSSAQDAIAYTGVSGSSMTWDHVRLLTCGRLNLNYLGLNNFTCQLDYVDIRDPQTSPVFLQADTARSSGVRRFLGWTAHSTSTLRSMTLYARDFSFDVTGLNVKLGQDIYDQDNTFENGLLIYNQVVNGMISGRSNTRLLIQHYAFLADQTGSDNPHYIVLSGSAAIGSDTSYRIICDGLGVEGSDSGDVHITDGSFAIVRPIIINRAGTIFPSNDPSARLTVTRATLRNTSGANANETSAGPDVIRAYRGCLFKDLADAIHQESTFASQTAFDLDYNGFYGMTNTANIDHPVLGVNSYLGPAAFAGWWTAGAYGDDNKGQHDKYFDPQFVDELVTAVTYYNSVFGSGFSAVNFAAEIVKVNGTAVDGSDATPTLTPAGYRAHIRVGLTPRNEAARGAGDPADGSPDLGAEDMAPVVVASVRRVTSVTPVSVVMC